VTISRSGIRKALRNTQRIDEFNLHASVNLKKYVCVRNNLYCQYIFIRFILLYLSMDFSDIAIESLNQTFNTHNIPLQISEFICWRPVLLMRHIFKISNH
jgi:hypothetical protein